MGVTMSKYIIGIDPGKKGGVAVLNEAGDLIFNSPLPESDELAKIFCNHGADQLIRRVYVEHCQSMPGQGVTSMFTYGVGFGRILGVLDSMRISYDLVRPQKWQKLMIPGAKTGQSKPAALVKAKQLFPGNSFIQPRCRKAHDGIVDALLIAEYGRLQHVKKSPGCELSRDQES